MQSVSTRFRRLAALLALLTLLGAQAAVAGERKSRGLVDRMERARQFIAVLFGRLSPPPGKG